MQGSAGAWQGKATQRAGHGLAHGSAEGRAEQGSEWQSRDWAEQGLDRAAQGLGRALAGARQGSACESVKTTLVMANICGLMSALVFFCFTAESDLNEFLFMLSLILFGLW